MHDLANIATFMPQRNGTIFFHFSTEDGPGPTYSFLSRGYSLYFGSLKFSNPRDVQSYVQYLVIFETDRVGISYSEIPRTREGFHYDSSRSRDAGS